MTYSNMGRCLGVDKNAIINVPVLSASAKKPAKLIITGYDGKNAASPGNAVDPQFSNHVQDAASLGIPAVALIRLYFDVDRAWVKEPSPMDEWNMQVLDKMIMNGSSKRKIDEIMVDARGIYFEDGDKLDQGNWKRVVEWFYRAARKQYDLPVRVLMNQSDIDKMNPDEQNSCIVALDGMNKINDNNNPGVICGVATPLPTLINPPDGSLPYPVDSMNKPYLGSGNRVYYTYIGYGLTVPGITGTVDLWLSDTPAPSAVIPVDLHPDDGTVTPPSADGDYSAQLNRIESTLNQIRAIFK